MGGLFSRLQRVAVLPPEVELIACAQRSLVVDDLAAAVGEPRGGGAGGARISLLPGAGKARQQRRARLPRLGVGLDDARDGGGDVEVDGLRLFHQLRQLRGSESAPPVQRRRRIRLAGVFVLRGNVERGIGEILREHAPARACRQAQRRKPAQRPGRRTMASPSANRRKPLCHICPLPGRPYRHRTAGLTDSQRDSRGTLGNSFTAAMLSADLRSILAGRGTAGQSRIREAHAQTRRCLDHENTQCHCLAGLF